jgi:antitoxin (DNA-binding transcriptional repressor) of toxin-antitoxin stability system
MKSVGTADLKANLSAHLRAVRGGEAVTVLDRKTPIARIVPYDGEQGLDLCVQPARGRLQDIPVPAPLSAALGDVLDDLLEARGDRL